MIVLIMVDMRFLGTSTVTHASRSGWHGLAKWGFAWELSKASCTSGGIRVAAAGALSLWVRTRVASLPTISHHSLPIDGAKSILGISGIAEDDVG